MREWFRFIRSYLHKKSHRWGNDDSIAVNGAFLDRLLGDGIVETVCLRYCMKCGERYELSLNKKAYIPGTVELLYVDWGKLESRRIP